MKLVCLWLCCDAIDVSIHIGMPCVRVSYLVCMGFEYLVVNFSSTPYREMPLCYPTSHGSSLLLRRVSFLAAVSVPFGEMSRDVMESL